MSLTDEPDDVNCADWTQPHIALRDLPRMAIDRQGLRAAAETIVRFEPPTVARDAAAHGDPRLAPFIREAMARRQENAA